MTPTVPGWYSHPALDSPRWFEARGTALGWWSFSRNNGLLFFQGGPHDQNWKKNKGKNYKKIDSFYRELLQKRHIKTEEPKNSEKNFVPLFSLEGKQ